MQQSWLCLLTVAAVSAAQQQPPGALTPWAMHNPSFNPFYPPAIMPNNNNNNNNNNNMMMMMNPSMMMMPSTANQFPSFPNAMMMQPPMYSLRQQALAAGNNNNNYNNYNNNNNNNNLEEETSTTAPRHHANKQQQQQQQPFSSSLTLMRMFPPPAALMQSLTWSQANHPYGGGGGGGATHPHAAWGMMAGRPGAPDVSGTHAPGEQINAQTGARTASGITTEVSSHLNTLAGSLSTTGSQLMGQAHSLFLPPYSWMWRVAMQGASLQYDNLNRVAEVPELLNLITGYYAGDAEAITAAHKAQTDHSDKYSLSNLSQLFGASSPSALIPTTTTTTTHQQQHQHQQHQQQQFVNAGKKGVVSGFEDEGGDEEEVSPFHFKSAAAGHGVGGGHKAQQPKVDESPLSALLHPLNYMLGSDTDTPSNSAPSGKSWDDYADNNNNNDDEEENDDNNDTTAELWKNFDMNQPDPKSQAPSSWMNSLFGGDNGSSSSKAPHGYGSAKHSATSNDFYSTYARDPRKKSSTEGSGLFGTMFPDHKKAYTHPGSSASGSGLTSLMSAFAGGNKGSDPTASMIKMAAPMLGIDPSLANMAAPILSSLL